MSTAYPSPQPSGPQVHRPHGGAAPTPRRSGRWRGLLLLAAVLLPILEITALVATGRAIGFWWTVALLIVVSVLGVWLIKREGLASWRALRDAGRAGRMPTTEVANAAVVLIAGALLLLPGFLSDVVALLLLLPGIRQTSARLLQRGVERRLMSSAGIVRSVRVGAPVVPGTATRRPAPEQDDPFTPGRSPRELPHIDLRPENER
ncbi:FxsA family protein [Mobilicoccus massiliensis]|uniref:FxsA family protein n=1 Tax=Mobilicoccus massiliensis TaxID=1522310 RepID=UPI0006950542|nr:FxsA family protein [Mobilicoccus massiliensis]